MNKRNFFRTALGGVAALIGGCVASRASGKAKLLSARNSVQFNYCGEWSPDENYRPNDLVRTSSGVFLSVTHNRRCRPSIVEHPKYIKCWEAIITVPPGALYSDTVEYRQEADGWQSKVVVRDGETILVSRTKTVCGNPLTTIMNIISKETT